MCLSTVFIEKDLRRVEAMQNVARMESQEDGFVLIGLLGQEKFVRGKIKRIDFMDQHIVEIDGPFPETDPEE
ncbi:MAG: CooT family nickel-binding protein [Desulfobacteraceae bacterium]|nr:MAG: CooT family nickel-binding protein [Desulfobacteraceae bacterium]